MEHAIGVHLKERAVPVPAEEGRAVKQAVLGLQEGGTGPSAVRPAEIEERGKRPLRTDLERGSVTTRPAKAGCPEEIAIGGSDWMSAAAGVAAVGLVELVDDVNTPLEVMENTVP